MGLRQHDGGVGWVWPWPGRHVIAAVGSELLEGASAGNIRLRDALFTADIERKPKRLAKGRQRPFGGVGLGGLDRLVMGLAGGGAMGFPGAIAVPDHEVLVGSDRDPDLGHVDGVEGAPVLPRQDTARFQGLSVPPIEAEDPIGLGNGMPALDVGQLPPIHLPGADIAGSHVTLKLADLCDREAHYFTLTLRTGSGLPSTAPSID